MYSLLFGTQEVCSLTIDPVFRFLGRGDAFEIRQLASSGGQIGTWSAMKREKVFSLADSLLTRCDANLLVVLDANQR